MGKAKGIVMDGRDIGTVVFPDAELKIFVTAENYFKRMKEKGIKIGVIRTQLGIPGFEQDGPFVAAESLVDFIKHIK